MDTVSDEKVPRARTKQGQILEGARRVFLREGYAGTSTDAVAREAGVSKRTLYAYYPSKEDLFVDVLRKLTIEHPEMRALEAIEGMSPGNWEEMRRDLLELAQKILTTMMRSDYLALLRTTIADSHRFPELAGLFRATVPERTMRSLAVFVERARERGVVRGDVDGDAAARMFIGPLLTYAVLNGLLAEGQPRPPEPQKIEGLVDLYMKAIA